MVRENIGVTIVPEMTLPADCSGLQILSLRPKRFRQLAFAVSPLAAPKLAVQTFLKEAQVWSQSLVEDTEP